MRVLFPTLPELQSPEDEQALELTAARIDRLLRVRLELDEARPWLGA
jgi:hypothetical protein